VATRWKKRDRAPIGGRVGEYQLDKLESSGNATSYKNNAGLESDGKPLLRKPTSEKKVGGRRSGGGFLGIRSKKN